MDTERAVIMFRIKDRSEEKDLDIPLDITANDLVKALDQAFDLGIDTGSMQSCFLRADNPKVLLKGSKTLAELGIRNGSIIYA